MMEHSVNVWENKCNNKYHILGAFCSNIIQYNIHFTIIYKTAIRTVTTEYVYLLGLVCRR